MDDFIGLPFKSSNLTASGGRLVGSTQPSLRSEYLSGAPEYEPELEGGGGSDGLFVYVDDEL